MEIDEAGRGCHGCDSCENGGVKLTQSVRARRRQERIARVDGSNVALAGRSRCLPSPPGIITLRPVGLICDRATRCGGSLEAARQAVFATSR